METAEAPVKVQMLVAPSIEAAALLRDGGFDLVFIDADHSYEAVRDDIAAWKAKVATAGILCGHDCESRATPAMLPRLMEYRMVDALPSDTPPFPSLTPRLRTGGA